METIGIIAFRKVVEDFAAVCTTIKQELANPDIASGIKDEVVKLGNQMDAQLDGLGETLKPLMEADAENATAGEAANAEGANLANDGLNHADDDCKDDHQAVADMESEGAPAVSNVIEMPATDSKPDATGDDRPLTAA